jgi:hypothetical protein
MVILFVFCFFFLIEFVCVGKDVPVEKKKGAIMSWLEKSTTEKEEAAKKKMELMNEIYTERMQAKARKENQ